MRNNISHVKKYGCEQLRVLIVQSGIKVVEVITERELHAFFISNTFISNGMLKSPKNQANAKQHPEAELLLFENYSHSSPTLSSKTIGNILKK